MKLLSLFSGIGAFEKALDRLEVPYELVGYCEIDKYASKSYAAIHGVSEDMNLGDITKVDEKALPKNIDLITYGFPCQDISLAGKQKGMFECEHCHAKYEVEENDIEKFKNGEKFLCEKCGEEIKLTRSGLFFEALRIIEETQPRVAIAENVKNLTSKKFNAQFQIVLASLEDAGYNNYWQVLNAKDYGIPQNRERVFICSIRKDIDTGTFKFPEGFPLELRLKDLLEDEVDEKFYISDKALKYMNNKDSLGNYSDRWTYCQDAESETAKCLTANLYKGVPYNILKEPQVKQLGNCCPTKTRENPNQGRIYDTEGLAPCLNRMGGGNRQPFVPVREATKKGYAEAFEGDSINLEHPNSKTRRGRVGKQIAQTLTTSCNQGVVEPRIEVLGNYSPSGHDASRIVSSEGLAPTVKENHGTVTAVAMRGRYEEDGTVHQNIEVSDREYANAIITVQKDSLVQSNLRIRKLTPKECFRLMDFDDEDFAKAEAVNSNTQLYKQAGNSIVVAVVYYTLKALIKANILIEKENKEMELKMNEYQLPEKISFNFEELKQELTEKVSMYETMYYTDEQIKDAKADKANLNKLKKALNDERIKREKEYMIPFNEFKAQVNEVISIIDKPIAVIDSQVKAYEEKQKQEKAEAIKSYWAELLQADKIPETMTLEMIFDSKWLNASVSMKSIKTAIDDAVIKYASDMDTLANLPEYSFEAQQMYISTLDIRKALDEAHRLSGVARMKAEIEATMLKIEEEQKAKAEAQQEEIVATQPQIEESESCENFIPSFDVSRDWLVIKAKVSDSEKQMIEQFMTDNNIEFKYL
ncbi:DNA (cytosine-5-)-methyltransferase [Bacillus infantis]|uniref:DNA (cytosine-5-)-methyltransferase n=1 Tax=Bacillus infantis TaxID=324767 RepID=UPI003CEA609E